MTFEKINERNPCSSILQQTNPFLIGIVGGEVQIDMD
jgi:hypothetical protein